ncbi:CbtA family protein [Chelativorans sp. YIM 93263]|uniref:CbtA family protein n=1 Tax=Chelativorans sp. YIM 93263 TaxID=2906648 RepID=UPI002377F637|nr:CbtA family protein [Chelativorans sp. YIM 93263]
MSVLRNAVFLAAIAGLFAGIAMTGLQTFFTVPLILEAETYEAGANAAHGHAHEHGHEDAAASGHHHNEDAWAPADGAERTIYTALANVVTGVGFGLLLVAVSELAGGISSWRQGLVWGFAGFAVFTLAPGLGLPPELPGMPAADLLARQTWWIATVCATAGGLALIAFGRQPLLAVLGVALIIAPHFVGAPQPATHDTAVPAELHHSFVVAVTLTNLVFWVLLGAAVGILRTRFAEGLGAARSSFA